MKKKNKKGFFLSETVIIIAIVTMVLLGVFKIFSAVYSKYKERENYDTTNATNVVTSMKKYYESVGLDYVSLLNDNFYVELTDSTVYDSEYYDKLKEITKVENIYLFDMDKLFEGSNINTFDISLRKYLKTWKNNIEVSVMLVAVLNGGEYGSVPIKTSATVTLVGEESDEFATYVTINETFTDPGYLNWSGNPPTTEWEIPLDTTKEGTYYLHYNFDGYILRRKVIVTQSFEQNFDYTSSAQTFTVPKTGYYKLEVWGAQGGGSGGYGAYAVGIANLNSGVTISIYVGGTTSTSVGGYNGGGSITGNVYGGGGATHIAIVSGLLNTLSSNQGSILVVAAGGGGKGNGYAGGNGGGISGGNGSGDDYGKGATQTAGGGVTFTNGANPGGFGYGGSASWHNERIGGGGGGFYGGGSGGGTDNNGGGGGGSSYIGNASLLTYRSITKSMYCYNCTTSSIDSTRTYSTTSVSETATSNTAKSGNGYAKITFINS